MKWFKLCVKKLSVNKTKFNQHQSIYSFVYYHKHTKSHSIFINIPKAVTLPEKMYVMYVRRSWYHTIFYSSCHSCDIRAANNQVFPIMLDINAIAQLPSKKQTYFDAYDYVHWKRRKKHYMVTIEKVVQA